MTPISDEQREKNWIFLWDIRRNIRYSAKRAGWFDSIHRLSGFLTALCGSGAFAAFAGDWPRMGFWCSGLVALLATVCCHFDYTKKAALYRSLKKSYLALLSATMDAGGWEAMGEDDLCRLTKAYYLIEAEQEETVPTALRLLMNVCENEVAEYDMERPTLPPNDIPWWSVFFRQTWFWRWPSKNRDNPNETPEETKKPSA